MDIPYVAHKHKKLKSGSGIALGQLADGNFIITIDRASSVNKSTSLPGPLVQYDMNDRKYLGFALSYEAMHALIDIYGDMRQEVFKRTMKQKLNESSLSIFKKTSDRIIDMVNHLSH